MVTSEFLSIIAVVFAALIGAFGAMYLKKGASRLNFNIRILIKNKNFLIGCSLYFISTLIFIPALRFNEVSVLYPFVATNYIWVILLSKKYLNEEIDSFKWLGILFIVLGVFFVGFGVV